MVIDILHGCNNVNKTNKTKYATIFGLELEPLMEMIATQSCLGILGLLLGDLRGLFRDLLFHHISVTLALWANSMLIQACGLLPGVPALTQNVLDALLGDEDLEKQSCQYMFSTKDLDMDRHLVGWRIGSG